MRNALASLTEIAGFACLCVGVWWIFPPAALIVAGIGLILAAQAGSR